MPRNIKLPRLFCRACAVEDFFDSLVGAYIGEMDTVGDRLNLTMSTRSLHGTLISLLYIALGKNKQVRVLYSSWNQSSSER